jgi:hypothetical protein
VPTLLLVVSGVTDPLLDRLFDMDLGWDVDVTNELADNVECIAMDRPFSRRFDHNVHLIPRRSA